VGGRARLPQLIALCSRAAGQCSLLAQIATHGLAGLSEARHAHCRVLLHCSSRASVALVRVWHTSGFSPSGGACTSARRPPSLLRHHAKRALRPWALPHRTCHHWNGKKGLNLWPALAHRTLPRLLPPRLRALGRRAYARLRSRYERLCALCGWARPFALPHRVAVSVGWRSFPFRPAVH